MIALRKVTAATILAAGVAVLGVVGSPAFAATFKFADQGDSISMDPHSLNETFQLNITGNMYEPLVGRGKSLELVPLLATSWKQTAPTIWRFNLRQGVKFHDGTPFNADDVIFSYERAKADGSDMKTYVGPIKEIKKIDDYTIDAITSEPFPILPDTINQWYMMSKVWCEKNNATAPVDVRKGKENAATLRVNGTGPFMLKAREPGVRTVLVPNPAYWDKIESNVTGGDFHTDQERRDASCRADLRRHRHDGTCAIAGHRDAEERRRAERASRTRAAHDLRRYGPVSR